MSSRSEAMGLRGKKLDGQLPKRRKFSAFCTQKGTYIDCCPLEKGLDVLPCQFVERSFELKPELGSSGLELRGFD